VTYALQDAAKHAPAVGLGNGIVSIFDMNGNFVQRFATGGILNAPWGITQASTTLTVTTSATVYHYGLLIPELLGPGALVVALALLSLVTWPSRRFRTARAPLLTVAPGAAIVALGLTIGGCGGYGSSTQSSRGTASITVTAVWSHFPCDNRPGHSPVTWKESRWTN
jgi:hypothetical protein